MEGQEIPRAPREARIQGIQLATMGLKPPAFQPPQPFRTAVSAMDDDCLEMPGQPYALALWNLIIRPPRRPTRRTILDPMGL